MQLVASRNRWARGNVGRADWHDDAVRAFPDGLSGSLQYRVPQAALAARTEPAWVLPLRWA